MNKAGIFFASVAVIAIWPVSAQAQEASGSAPQSEKTASEAGEIIVTGLKRDQAFIDVPVSVQVFNEAAITRAGITRPQDFLSQTSNITFIQSNHAGEAFVNVRGQTSVRQSESAVAVVIDGVPLATQNEFNGELFDIQQIEVLKGPQGAIYGRNAAAGAIIITTKAPTDDFEGSVLGSYGNWNSAKASFSASGAIIPGTLRVRLSGAINKTDGDFRNIETGEYSMRSEESLARLRFDWIVSDKLNVDLRFNISRLIGGGIAANAQGPGIVLGGIPSPVNGNATGLPFVTDVPGYNRQDKFSTSLKLDADLDFATITSVTSYNQIADNYQAKLFPYVNTASSSSDSGLGILFGDKTQKYRIANKAFAQEIRLTSNDSGSFRWQIGGYFLDSERTFHTEEGYNGRVPLNPDGSPNTGPFGSGFVPNPNGLVRGDASSLGLPTRWDRILIGGGAIAPTLGIDGLASSNPTSSYDIAVYKARNFAPFANAQFDFTESLELGVAARYDIERRSVRNITPTDVNPFTGASFNNCVAIFNVALDQCNRKRTFKQLSPKATLTYKLPNGNGSIFASWGKSFKSGGFNSIGTRERTIRGATVGDVSREEAEALVFVQDDYDKEVADSYEIGFKSRLFDRRVNLNGAVFLTNVRNAQQFIFFPASSIQAVQTIDKVRNKGFEFDINGNVSDALSLFAGFGYVDSKIKKYAAQPTSVGNRAPYVSNYNLSVGAQLNQPITDTLELVARGEYNRTGSLWFDAPNTPNTKREAVGIVNARLGLANERWELTAWSRNLLDRNYRMESVVLVTGIGVFNPGFEAFGRSFGLEGRVKF